MADRYGESSITTQPGITRPLTPREQSAQHCTTRAEEVLLLVEAIHRAGEVAKAPHAFRWHAERELMRVGREFTEAKVNLETFAAED